MLSARDWDLRSRAEAGIVTAPYPENELRKELLSLPQRRAALVERLYLKIGAH